MRENKDYELLFAERMGYLYAHLTAPTLTNHTITDALAEAVELCRAKKIRRLMLFRDIAEVLPDSQKFFAGVEAAELLHGIKFALVDPDPAHTSALHFFETVIMNRGVLNKTFTNESDAEAWLLT